MEPAQSEEHTMPNNETRPTTSAGLAAVTPTERNRFVDFLRAACIGVVVLGHWLMAVLWWENGKLTGENLLLLVPSIQPATWLLQIMPAFFIVGGFANAASWESAGRLDVGYGEWLSARARRMLRPAVAFLVAWVALPLVAVALGMPALAAEAAVREISAPLWFLAVYLVMVAIVPVLITVHRRIGPARLLVALTTATLAVDVAHFGAGVGAVAGWTYVIVWLAILELGLCWRDGLPRSPRTAAVLAAGAFTTMVALVVFAHYPVSMVNLSSEVRSNVFPPTLMLLALGILQFALIRLVEPRAQRWLQRPRVWFATAVANTMVLTAYLWNMTAVLFAAATVLRVLPRVEPDSTAWLLQRPLWLATCAAFLVPLVAVFRHFESPTHTQNASAPSAAAAIAGVGACAYGLSELAKGHFPVPGYPVSGGVIAVIAVAIGLALLTVPGSTSRLLDRRHSPV